MIRDISNDKSAVLAERNQLNLPSLPEGFEAAFNSGNSFQSDGTNVVRVPFGIRRPLRKRPDHPERLATLVIPFNPDGNPTPPPQAA